MDNASRLRILHRSVKKLRAAENDAVQGGPPLTGKRIDVESENGRIIQTWLHPADTKHAPLLFDLHGGGFVMGNPCKNDAFCDWIARVWKVNVVSVGYSLAPENPYPAAVEDVCAALLWYRQNADRLGMDPERIYLQGYSAGANLAFAGLLRLMKQNRMPVKGIIAHYPFLDAATSPALKQVRDIDLPVEMMEAFNSWYVGEDAPSNPEISPVFAPDDACRRFPKTFITAVVGDSLFDEAMSMAVRMKSLGVDCTFRPIQDAYHGYVEDAVNTRVYYATSFPETREARPAGYRETARDAVCGALQEFFGQPRDEALCRGFWEEETPEAKKQEGVL